MRWRPAKEPLVCSLSLLTYLPEPQIQFSSGQSLSHVRLFVTPSTAVHQASLSITNSWSLLKFMSMESAMPSSRLIFCHSLLLLPSTFPSIRVFSKESVLCIRWPKYWPQIKRSLRLHFLDCRTLA